MNRWQKHVHLLPGVKCFSISSLKVSQIHQNQNLQCAPGRHQGTVATWGLEGRQRVSGRGLPRTLGPGTPGLLGRSEGLQQGLGILVLAAWLGSGVATHFLPATGPGHQGRPP